MNRAIARQSSPIVVSVEQACHAGGRGFESRRSRQISLHRRHFCCRENVIARSGSIRSGTRRSQHLTRALGRAGLPERVCGPGGGNDEGKSLRAAIALAVLCVGSGWPRRGAGRPRLRRRSRGASATRRWGRSSVERSRSHSTTANRRARRSRWRSCACRQAILRQDRLAVRPGGPAAPGSTSPSSRVPPSSRRRSCAVRSRRL